MIVDTNKSDEEKTKALHDFFDAADATREAIVSQECSPKNPFGTILRKLREDAGITQTQLADTISEIGSHIDLSQGDIYFIESGIQERNITPQESLAIVKALDTKIHPLSEQDKLDLYDRAKQVFVRNSQLSNKQSGNEVNSVDADSVRIQSQRKILKAFFTDRDGSILENKIITERSGLSVPAISSLLKENSIVNPKKGGGVSVLAKQRLCELLTALGKDQEVVDKFCLEFEKMRNILNYKGPYRAVTREL